MPSFDVVSKLSWAEVGNALNQASKEVGQRYDFKDTDASLEQGDKLIVVRANSEERAQAALDVLREKLVRRKVSLMHLEAKDPEPGPKGGSKITVLLKEGVEIEKARAIVKLIKDGKLKVQATIQGDSVRVTGKKRDDLQDAIRLLRAAELGVELQFENFRD